MSIKGPLFLIGAPRSGTSSVFSAMRKATDSWSMPSEGSYIWNKLVHPANHDWKGEMLNNLSDRERQWVIDTYYHYSLPSQFWNRISTDMPSLKSGFGAWLRSLARLYLQKPVLVAQSLRFKRGIDIFVIEKSVRAGLWIDQLSDIFPNIHYIHLTRNPLDCLSSMKASWSIPERFKEYRIPGKGILVNGNYIRDWCFSMPPSINLAKAYDSIDEIVCLQWIAIQESILQYTQSHPEKVDLIKVEDLTGKATGTMKLNRLLRQYDSHSKPIMDISEKLNKNPDRDNQETIIIPHRLIQKINEISYALGYRKM